LVVSKGILVLLFLPDYRVDNSLSCVVGCLTGIDVELQEEAAWCLANISAGTHVHAMAVAKTAAPYLITLLSSNNHKLQVRSISHSQELIQSVSL